MAFALNNWRDHEVEVDQDPVLAEIKTPLDCRIMNARIQREIEADPKYLREVASKCDGLGGEVRPDLALDICSEKMLKKYKTNRHGHTVNFFKCMRMRLRTDTLSRFQKAVVDKY